MKYFGTSGAITTFVLQFDEGDLLLESINEFIEVEGILSGAVVSGIGTLDQATLHMITTTTYPPELTFPRWGSAPLELVSMQGAIVDGVPHIHATLAREGQVFAGHLEDRCRVLYLAEVVIFSFSDLNLTRVENGKEILKITEARVS